MWYPLWKLKADSPGFKSQLWHFVAVCLGEGNGNPLQCSCLENPRERGTCWAAVYGVAQSRARLKRLGSSSCVYDLSYLTSLNLSYFVCKMLTAVIFSWRNCLMPTGLWSLNTDACSSCYYKPPLWEIWSSSEKARGKSRSRQKWLMLQMSTSVDTAKHSATPMSPGRESILSEKLI